MLARGISQGFLRRCAWLTNEQQLPNVPQGGWRKPLAEPLAEQHVSSQQHNREQHRAG